MLKRIFLVLIFLPLSLSVFAATDVNIVSSAAPMPVYITASNPALIQTDPVSQYVQNVTLGDIWVLQLVLGFVQCALLGAIHGHQR